jgi:nucleoside-diphosphate-sugar epimerase
MPAIKPNSTVLVTGASGYIGAWVVKDLVDRGHKVRAVLRTAPQGEALVNAYPEYKGKVTYVVVPDIQKDGAYDEAVVGVDGIVHVASPVIFVIDDPKDLIDPAVNGALGILKSAQKFGPTVQRVVLTSSTMSINGGDATPPALLDETLWNESSPAHVKAEGKKSSPWATYAASKTLAEKAAWDYVKANKTNFDLVAILPSFNWGPWIHPVATKDKLGSTIGVFLSTFAGPDGSGSLAGDFVDVRDTAAHHSLALETPAAGGERIISSSGPFAWQDIYDILNEAGFPNVPKGNPGAGKNKVDITYDHSKSEKLFPSVKYRDLKTSVKEMGDTLAKNNFF